MKSVLLRNATAVLPDTKPFASILIEDGRISRITKKPVQADEVIEIGYLTVMPGFIDIHNHGAVGVDVNTADTEKLREVGKFLVQHGVTAWLPTLVPDSDKNFKHSIKAIDNLVKIQEKEQIAQILGVHYEGIFANEKMCGALRPEYFRQFTNDAVAKLPKLKRGIHLTTLAPEIKNGIKLIKELKKQNWLVSLGHTRADFEILDKAYEAGANHLTHFFNAMTGLHHREIGVAGWGLMNSDITFDIIADGIHVNSNMIKLACQIKKPDKVSLISDSVAPTGLGDGKFELWGEKITVKERRTQNERGSIAGSVITMLDAVKRMLALGFSFIEVARMASSNPAKLLGIEQDYGSIEVGKRADLVVLDPAENVRLCLIGGEVAFSDL